MNHSILSLLEYALMPFLLVFSTAVIKHLIKRSSRIKWYVTLSIGLEIILMCAFGSFIYGISIHNHLENNLNTMSIVVCSFIISFVLFLLTVILALLIRHWGEHSKNSFWVQNIVAVILLVSLLIYISNGVYLFNK